MLQPKKAVALAQLKWTVGIITVSAGRKISAPSFYVVHDKDHERAQNSLWDNKFVCERQIGERVEGDGRQIIYFLFPVLQNEDLI